MTDSSWMRLLPGQRCRTPARPSSPRPVSPAPSLVQNDHGGYDNSLEPAFKTAPRTPSGLGQTHGAAGCDLLVREADRVWHNPSVEQMAEALRIAIMTAPTVPTLGPEYTSYVLHLIEGYGAIQKKLADKEKELAWIEALRQNDEDIRKSLAADWATQEDRYKAEIKRLEMFIHDTSEKGIEAVVMARSGSLIRKGGTGKGATSHISYEFPGKTENLPPGSSRDDDRHGTKPAPSQTLCAQNETDLDRQKCEQQVGYSRGGVCEQAMVDQGSQRVPLSQLSSSWTVSLPVETKETGIRQDICRRNSHGSAPIDAIEQVEHSNWGKGNCGDEHTVACNHEPEWHLPTGGNGGKQALIGNKRQDSQVQHRRDFSFAPGDDNMGLLQPRMSVTRGVTQQDTLSTRQAPDDDVDRWNGTSKTAASCQDLLDSEPQTPPDDVRVTGALASAANAHGSSRGQAEQS